MFTVILKFTYFSLFMSKQLIIIIFVLVSMFFLSLHLSLHTINFATLENDLFFYITMAVVIGM